MVTSSHQLVRLRTSTSRKDELAGLKQRLRDAIRARRRGPSGSRELALEVRQLKQRISGQLAEVRSCTTCAQGYPWPAAAFDGGLCCSGVTADVFSDREVEALAAAGTRVRDLRPPTDTYAGCVFRGATGCSLEPADRPSVCIRYLCKVLRHELHSRGLLDALESDIDELAQVFARFVDDKAAGDREALLHDIETELTRAVAKRRT